MPWFCHSIPNPIHLGLECWTFWTETVIQMKAAMGNARFVCWNNACWVVGMTPRGLRPNINFLASLTEVDLQKLAYSYFSLSVSGMKTQSHIERKGSLSRSLFPSALPCSLLFCQSNHQTTLQHRPVVMCHTDTPTVCVTFTGLVVPDFYMSFSCFVLFSNYILKVCFLLKFF